MTSATDELRRMLDERGVKWTYGDGTVSYASDGRWFHAWAYNDGEMCVSMGYLTPEQAIEATLGRRTTTRHGKFRTKYGRSVPCCECCGYGIGDERWHYCPSCGAEVVDE